MRRINHLRISLKDFHKLMKTIRKSSGKTITASSKNLMNTVMKATGYKKLLENIPDEVKMAILRTAGYEPYPEDLDEDDELSEFDFPPAKIIKLAMRLNKIAKKYKPSARSISTPSVQDAETVQDCIDLVNKAVA